ncbi:hypothetical protein GCM10027347_61170 [Larkinella harenae]
MEKIITPRAGKRPFWVALKSRFVRAWNACLPNYVDIHICTSIGPLFLALIEVESDNEEMFYDGGGCRKYLPRFALGVIKWEKAIHSHFKEARAIIGYQLNHYDTRGESEYWHIIVLAPD